MCSQLLYYAKRSHDIVEALHGVWEVFKAIKWCWSVRGVVPVALFLLIYGRTPVKGLENMTFNGAPIRITWGTLFVLVMLTAAALSHVRQHEAISA